MDRENEAAQITVQRVLGRGYQNKHADNPNIAEARSRSKCAGAVYRVNCRTFTAAMGGTFHGAYGTAPCPVCQPERRADQNALAVADKTDGGLLLHCKKGGCGFRDILAAAGVTPGTFEAPDPLAIREAERQRQADAVKRAKQARCVWREALPIGGTLAEVYLRSRSITCPLPDTLRFHPEAWHLTGKRFPAMLALVEGGRGFAVHRTYLCADGSGKADVNPTKAMLGAVGDGAVSLTESQGPLVVAEGIETALSLACGLLRAPASIWAALSTSGLRGLSLPATPHRLTIATDGDEAGRAAGHSLATRAKALGWAVSIFSAPDGRDWNDVLAGKVVVS